LQREKENTNIEETDKREEKLQENGTGSSEPSDSTTSVIEDTKDVSMEEGKTVTTSADKAADSTEMEVSA
jgi:hypothetical protein